MKRTVVLDWEPPAVILLTEAADMLVMTPGRLYRLLRGARLPYYLMRVAQRGRRRCPYRVVMTPDVLDVVWRLRVRPPRWMTSTADVRSARSDLVDSPVKSRPSISNSRKIPFTETFAWDVVDRPEPEPQGVASRPEVAQGTGWETGP